ncbi:hypothetical protein FDUTEX481_08392 [Tolypothrix sp. PCC 7601]|nr:hypothetical protein FDUTEX481_08392 [Tolypothrix sp. PCC 7601]
MCGVKLAPRGEIAPDWLNFFSIDDYRTGIKNQLKNDIFCTFFS